MVAYHFPPLRGSSGIHRTLGFVKYLPEFGWNPLVLTAHPRAYEQIDEDTQADVPTGVHVSRAFALDSARQLSIASRYPAFLARPDRWISWWFGGVPTGFGLVRRFRPQVIWSTYPIATAHMIGKTLQRLTRLPWVADFRDPMAQPGYPADKKTWVRFAQIEQAVISRAAALVFASPGAQKMYRTRYPGRPSDDFHLVENGYDEASFAPLRDVRRTPLWPGKLTILHSGIVYPDERDPSQLLLGLRYLIDRGVATPETLRIRFRAAVHVDFLRAIAARTGVESLIETGPLVPYQGALAEMLRADALLIMQGANCNEQIPAKLYEYFAAGRPILALTDPLGDTARKLRESGHNRIARLDDAEDVFRLLTDFIRSPDKEVGNTHSSSDAPFSRRERAAELAALLDSLTQSHFVADHRSCREQTG